MTRISAIRLVRYAVVGIITLAIYLAIGEVVHRLNIPLFWRAPVPFAAAVAANYLLQRAWVFEDPRPTFASLPKFVVMIIVGYVINFLALLTFLPRMPLLLAELSAVVLVVLSNAIFSFWWVFVRHGAGPEVAR